MAHGLRDLSLDMWHRGAMLVNETPCLQSERHLPPPLPVEQPHLRNSILAPPREHTPSYGPLAPPITTTMQGTRNIKQDM